MNEISTVFSKHKGFNAAIDFVILGFDEGELKILATKRNDEPADKRWFHLSGFLEDDLNLDDAASRILTQLTALSEV